MTDDSRPTTFRTADGLTLEGVLHLAAAEPRAIAIVTHPHPLMGGDMHNPVPAGVARGLTAAGVTALRFNFRGAGRSDGVHDEGGAEQDDVRAAIDAVAVELPVSDLLVFGVGYSFGADVLLGTLDPRLAGVTAVAPPLRVLGPDQLAAPRGAGPTLVLSPAHDQFCPPDRARGAVAGWPKTSVEEIAGADHFLTGAVARVVERSIAFAEDLLG